ncbi:MAG: roadblock/LC7 domain-containing protein [Promethearchaeota archaeon]
MEKNSDSYNILLDKLRLTNSDVKGSFILSKKGVPISSKFPQNIDDSLISPMLAAIHSMAERFMDECSIGSLQQVVIEGKESKIIITQAGREHVLCVILEPSAKVELTPSQY